MRRRAQQETLGHRGRKHDPVSSIRRLLLRAPESLGERGRVRLDACPPATAETKCSTPGWPRRPLRAVYGADGMAEAAERFDAFVAECRGSSVPELHRLAGTAGRWRT